MSLSSPKTEKFEFEYVVIVVVFLPVIVFLIIIIIIVIILMVEDYWLEVLVKTPALYQVPKLRNLKSGKILNR